jgi:hypothetical protein
MNNASKGRCVTVTPRGTRICGLDSRISPPAQFPKCIRVMIETPVRRSAIRKLRSSEGAEQLAAKITVESVASQPDRSWAAANQGSYGAHNFS